MLIKDRIAVIWTRLGNQPVKMGTLTVTDVACRFTYEAGYAETGLRGLGLVYPPQQFADTMVRERNEYFDFFPPLQCLIPPRSERNFQRTLLLKYLQSINVNTPPGFDTDWEMLIRSGHGAIGHLDVFSNDEAALQWYAAPAKKALFELDDKFGFSLKEFMTWFDDEAESLIDVLGPTPTVGGAIPKLPLSINRAGWDGRIGLPTRFGDTGLTDIILKLENSAAYPGIIELEILGLDIHKAAGFDVPRYWPVEVNGLRALAIERFDRTANGSAVFMESIYSILASGRKTVTNHYSASYDSIGAALDSPHIQLVTDRKAAKLHLLERFIMAVLTGNGDLHLENLSILEQDGALAFSPVYDPVAMRAYSIHNQLYPRGMGFGDYAEMPNDLKADKPVDFKTAFLRFAKSLGIHKNIYMESIRRLMLATLDYAERINQLKTLPSENKLNLIRIHQEMRRQFEKI